MKQHVKANLAMGAFLCACLIPSVGMLFLPEQPPAANQTLAQPPALAARDGGLNPQVLDEITEYAADHFALRQSLITANAALEAAVFGTSAQDSVLLGREGWLFYRETVEDYLHTSPLTGRELFGAARTLALLTEYAQSHGARLVFTVAPNKASLYPQYLPYVGAPLEGAADIDRLVPLLREQGVEYADLFASFRGEEQVLYYAGDSHWTCRGAALAHDTLIDALKLERQIRWFVQPGRAVQAHRGDLYEMLYPAGEALEEDTQFDRPFTFSHVRPVRSPEDQRIQTETLNQENSLLMFRDSFGNALYPFMAESFGNALFSRSMPFQMELLEETGADTVVIELVERNLDYLARRAPIFPAPLRELAGEPAPGEAAVRMTALDDGKLEGFLRLEGAAAGPMEEDSPIYVQLGTALYEATPAGEAEEGRPFTLYVPSDTPLDDVRVLYLLNSRVTAAGRVELEQSL